MLNQSKELLKIKIKMRKKLIKAGYDSHYINDLSYDKLEFFYRREFM
jgi:hypothetical protein